MPGAGMQKTAQINAQLGQKSMNETQKYENPNKLNQSFNYNVTNSEHKQSKAKYQMAANANTNRTSKNQSKSQQNKNYMSGQQIPTTSSLASKQFESSAFNYLN
jgi:hypothetical protein